ncbi:MAG: recombination protein O N-terminal domain-containing protein [Acidobacteriota bacterium]
MPTGVSESFVLRSYPFREGDLIVSFFTRDHGKLRGVARRAKRPKSPVWRGVGTAVPRADGVLSSGKRRIGESFELRTDRVRLGVQAGYDCSLALDYFTEVSEHLLPAQEPFEKFFRLLAAMLDICARAGEVWRAIDYFTLWSVRLSGVLPSCASATTSRNWWRRCSRSR